MFKTAIKEFYLYVFGHLAEVVLPENLKNTDKSRKNKILASKRSRKIRLFSQILNNPELSKKFRVALRSVKSNTLEALLYGDHTSDFSEIESQYSLPSDEDIQKKLVDLNQQYGGYLAINPALINNFITLFKMCKLTADFIEKNGGLDDELAFEQAYKMMVFFGINFQEEDPFEVFERYVKSLAFENQDQPVHYALVLPLTQITSEQKAPDLEKWQTLIKKEGKQATHLFQRASDIEAILTHAPNSLEEATGASSKLSYERADENSEFAILALQYNVAEGIFDKCLDVYAKRKKSDTLPNVHIDGKTVAALHSLKMKGQPADYHLVKLPIDDPRFLIMGYIVICCQSIGGHSERCVIDGGTLENNGFYVLLKRTAASKQKKRLNPSPYNADGSINYQDFEIVGVGYFWRGRFLNFVFDSWENSHTSKYDLIVAPMLKELAKKIVETDKNALRVTIGTGGKTPEALKNVPVSPSPMYEGYLYRDSRRQSLLYADQHAIDQQLKAIKEQLKKILSDGIYEDLSKLITFNCFYSQMHIQLLQFILKDVLTMSKEKYAHYIQQCLKYPEISMELNAANLLSTNHLERLVEAVKIASKEKLSFMREYYFDKIMSDLPIALSGLNRVGHLNSNNFALMLKSGEHADNMAEAIVIAHRSGLESELELIQQHPKSSRELVRGMVIFQEAGQFNNTTRGLLIKYRESADCFAESFLTLSKSQQISIQESTELPEDFWDFLLFFKTAKLEISDSFFQALLTIASCHDSIVMRRIRETLALLTKINLLTAQTAQAMLIDNPSYAYEVNDFIRWLYYQGSSLLTANTVSIMIKQLEYPRDLQRALSKIDITDMKNFMILLACPNKVESLFLGFYAVHIPKKYRKLLGSHIELTCHMSRSVKVVWESENLTVGKYIKYRDPSSRFKRKRPTDSFIKTLIQHFKHSEGIANALLAFEEFGKMSEDNLTFLFDHPERAQKIATIDLNTDWQKTVLSDSVAVSKLTT